MGVLKFIVGGTVGGIVVGSEIGFALGEGRMRGLFFGFGDGESRVGWAVVAGGGLLRARRWMARRRVVAALGRRAKPLVLAARASARRQAVQQRPRYTALALHNNTTFVTNITNKRNGFFTPAWI